MTKRMTSASRNEKKIPEFIFKNKFPLLCFAIFILGLLIYSNTWHVPFLFDDSMNIKQNISLYKTWDIPAIWSSNNKIRFLPFVSFAINHALGKDQVWGYHLFNLAVHLLNSIWVYFLISLLLITPKMKGKYPEKAGYFLAAFSSLIFLSHPLQTQSVTYIVQRMTSLTAFFYLGTIIFYLKARLTQNKIHYGMAFGMNLAAMFCKETAFTLPLALLLVEFLFFDFSKKNLLRLIPFLATMAIIPYFVHSEAASYNIHSKNFLPIRIKALPRGDYFLTELNVLCTYLRLFLLPVNQNFDYDYPTAHSLWEPKTLACLFLLGTLLAAALGTIKKNRFITFSIFWFFLTLSVESSVIPLEDVIFEHRMYLPLVGCALLLGIGLFSFLEKASYFMVAGSLVVMIFSCMAYTRNHIWGSEQLLWEDVIKKSPNKARPYNNLGNYFYHSLHDPIRAKESYEKALEKDPHFAISYFNLATLFHQSGNFEKALPLYQKAIESDPEFYDSYNNLGLLYDAMGQQDLAIEILQKAIQKFPTYYIAYVNLGIFNIRKRNIAEAVTNLEAAIKINPFLSPAYYNLGLIARGRKEFEKAINLLQKACSLDPHNAEMIYDLGEAYAQTGNVTAAQKQLEKLEQMQEWDRAKRLSQEWSKINNAELSQNRL